MLKFSLAIMLCWLTASSFAAVQVIVHPSNSANISKDDVNRLYTGRASSFPGGGQAVPINLVETHKTRNDFDEKALGRSSSQIKAHWSKLVFTGKGTPPKEVDSDAEVLELVANNPSIIGYVSKGAATDKVKVVLEID
jgi:ABC-type phosphate transport system substrate-binding protein